MYFKQHPWLLTFRGKYWFYVTVNVANIHNYNCRYRTVTRAVLAECVCFWTRQLVSHKYERFFRSIIPIVASDHSKLRVLAGQTEYYNVA